MSAVVDARQGPNGLSRMDYRVRGAGNGKPARWLSSIYKNVEKLSAAFRFYFRLRRLSVNADDAKQQK
jgi:hypothetical protein